MIQLEDEFLEDLQNLFDHMEKEYDRVAEIYQFSCDGCTQNCCTTNFQHYTVLEMELLKAGLSSIPEEEKNEIVEKARIAVEEKKAGGNPRCPILLENRCRMYKYRPMLCRMHGQPYLLKNPVSGTVMGDGCLVFQEKNQPPYETQIDRTTFFIKFAELERRARESGQYSSQAKARTIPEMILELENL